MGPKRLAKLHAARNGLATVDAPPGQTSDERSVSLRNVQVAGITLVIVALIGGTVRRNHAT